MNFKCMYNNKIYRFRESSFGEQVGQSTEPDQTFDHVVMNGTRHFVQLLQSGREVDLLGLLGRLCEHHLHAEYRVWPTLPIPHEGFAQFLEGPFHIQAEGFFAQTVHPVRVFGPVLLHLIWVVLEQFLRSSHYLDHFFMRLEKLVLRHLAVRFLEIERHRMGSTVEANMPIFGTKVNELQ